MSADPAVSVIVPVRDGERWVSQAIESMLHQTLRAFELIIVDDGSSDGTPDLLQALSRRDDRIRLVQQNPEGLVHALNRGLALARAPLVARLDADDVAASERLARQVACFDRDRRLVLLGSWAIAIDGDGREVGRLRPEADAHRLSGILLRRNPFVHSAVMMRTQVARDLGGYRQAFLGAEDYDLWLRLSERGTIANLPQALVRYRVHAGNTSRALGLRQSFSVRLAQAAAAVRRSHGIDPADRLRAPPDWWAPAAATSFYAEAAQVCRFLDCADRSVLDRCASREVLPPDARQLLGLSHAETRLAYRSLLNIIMAGKRPAPVSLGKATMMAAILLLGRPFLRG